MRKQKNERVPCGELRKAVAAGKGLQVQTSLWFSPEDAKAFMQWVDDQGIESVAVGVRLLLAGSLATFPEWHIPRNACQVAVSEARRYMHREFILALNEIIGRYEDAMAAGRSPFNFEKGNE